MSANNAFNTIEDYVAFWKGQSIETLQAIAAEHMGGYDPAQTKDELVAYLTKGMEDLCADHAPQKADYSALIRDRYSVRSFKPQPIEDAKLAAVLEAGRIAPTACNNQPQRIKVITGGDLVRLDECTPCRFGAPMVLLVCYDKSQLWARPFDGALSGDVDAAIVTTHMMLAAQEQGLGSCWVMYFDPSKTRELFALPENIIPVAYLPIGYPAEDCKPADRHFERKALEEILL